jgi:soluble lytic murein transglycosylase-like protein
MDPPYLQIFKGIAAAQGLNCWLLVEQAWRESRWNALAVGGAGEYGLMQIHPLTWSQWASSLHISDPFDPESNIRVAAAYWVWLQQQLQPRQRIETYWLLAAYNWGINHVLRLLDAAGTWADVPAEVREYAYDIVLGAEVWAVKASWNRD